jgi:hypothetical protein
MKKRYLGMLKGNPSLFVLRGGFYNLSRITHNPRCF